MKNKQTPLLEVRNVSKSYYNDGNEVAVLKNISLSVESGEVVTIMGPSGIGKSTLLNLIGTLDTPDSGEIFYRGINPFGLAEKEIARFRNSSIGFVFQFHHLLPEFTSLENVMIPTIIYRRDRQAARQRALRLLERVGLQERIEHRPAALSGGERQRVAVARALMNNPLVVLADEPSGNLDLANSAKLLELILEINKQFQRTFIIATHDRDIAAKSHRIIQLGSETCE